MAPLTTGAPPAAAHAIHAQADSHARHKKAAQHAAPAKSRAPKLQPRRSTRVAKTAVRAASPYRVRPGDNLATIAARQHVSLAALVKANAIGNPNHVLSGAVLRVPHRAAPYPATTKAPATKHPATKHPAATQHRTTPKRTTPRKAAPKKTAPSAKDRAAAARTAERTRATRAALARRPAPSRTSAKALIEKTARRYGVSPKLALGVGWQESGWNQRVVSPVNAVGIMQVMPQSGEWASGMVGRKLNLLDAHDNITAGVAILRYLTSNATNLNQAIGGYYQGLGGIQEHGQYDETRHYVRNVRALMHRL